MSQAKKRLTKKRLKSAKAIDRTLRPLAPPAWIELLVPSALRDEPITREGCILYSGGKLGGHNVSLVVLDFADDVENLDGLVRAFDMGARRSGVVVVLDSTLPRFHDLFRQAMQKSQVLCARERLGAAKSPLVFILTAPVSEAVAETVAELADIILSEASTHPSHVADTSALDAGLIDQVVERGRIPGVLGCLFEAMSAPKQKVS